MRRVTGGAATTSTTTNEEKKPVGNDRNAAVAAWYVRRGIGRNEGGGLGRSKLRQELSCRHEIEGLESF